MFCKEALLLFKLETGARFFPNKEQYAHQKSHRLPNDRGNCRAHHPPGENPYKQVVQKNIGQESHNHGSHGGDGASHVADKGDQPRPQYLENGAIADIEQIFLSQCFNFAGSAEKVKDSRGAQ